MLEPTDNGIAIIRQSALFPFLLELRDVYVVSKPSWVEEEPSAKSNQSDGLISDSQKLISHFAPMTEVKRTDPHKEVLRVKALQRWTGRVEEVTKDGFIAVVSDVTNPSNPDEEVELDLEDVPSSDHRLVTKGAVFYWAITYRDSKAGERMKTQTIRFARHPRLSSRDMQDIFNEADAITAILESA